MFPGAVGIDLAKMFDTAFAHLARFNTLDCGSSRKHWRRHRWIAAYELFDSRKERGGIQSYARSKRKGIYERKVTTVRPDTFPQGDSSCGWHCDMDSLTNRFSWSRKDFGPQKFHGRVVILVNEHTASAGEMVAAFAEENGLATIVGTKTPGRLAEWHLRLRRVLATSWDLPVAAYLTWQGRLIEGKGVTPSVPVELLPDDLLAGQDPQMQKAIEIVRGM